MLMQAFPSEISRLLHRSGIVSALLHSRDRRFGSKVSNLSVDELVHQVVRSPRSSSLHTDTPDESITGQSNMSESVVSTHADLSSSSL
jgi:hypothetical protein